MNAALDRDPATPVSFQAELRRDGGVVGRYDLPHPATNFAIAAFGETALAVCGGVTNAATVRRVDGTAIPETSLAELLRDATRFELVWRAAEGDPDADPDGDGLTTRDEIGRHSTDPKQADTDGDGLSDAAEILLGSNPLDADENGDGVPDGVDPADWAAHALWPTNKTGNIIVSLVEAIPTNMAATFQIGDLSIPLRDPDTWTFSLEPGVAYAYRLFVTDGATANLAITNDVPGPPMRGATSWGRPLWDEGTGGVFDGPSFGGEGELAILLAKLHWDDPGDGSHASGNDICVHGGNEAVFTPSLFPAIAGEWTLDGFSRRGISFVLSVPDDGEVRSATATLGPGVLRFGEISLEASAHKSDATRGYPWCSRCLCYEALDCELVPSKRLLTLKHDNEVYLDVVHSNSAWVPLENVVADIRRAGEDEWTTLGPATNLLPWTARVAGTFELRVRGVAEGLPFATPVAEIEVQFPSIYDIIGDTNVQTRALQEWNATLDDCTESPPLRREHGYWILLDTATGTYGTWTNCYGVWVPPETNATIKIPPPDPDVPEDPSPLDSGVVYPVAWFHTHTPTTYSTNRPGPGRGVGPSGKDRQYSINHSMPGIAYDYLKDPLSATNLIPYGWPKNKPATMYPINTPERRLFP